MNRDPLVERNVNNRRPLLRRAAAAFAVAACAGSAALPTGAVAAEKRTKVPPVLAEFNKVARGLIKRADRLPDNRVEHSHNTLNNTTSFKFENLFTGTEVRIAGRGNSSEPGKIPVKAPLLIETHQEIAQGGESQICSFQLIRSVANRKNLTALTTEVRQDVYTDSISGHDTYVSTANIPFSPFAKPMKSEDISKTRACVLRAFGHIAAR
jgi:hypothetical protein